MFISTSVIRQSQIGNRQSHVMSRRQIIRPELVRYAQKFAELNEPVAPDTGVGRYPLFITFQKIIDYLLPKSGGQIDRIEFYAELLAYLPRRRFAFVIRKPQAHEY